MSAPNLTTTVEPSAGGSVHYLSLAPNTAGDAARGQVSLVLNIRNNGAAQVHVNKLVVSFVGAPAVASSTIAVDLTIPSGGQQGFAFETANNITIPVPAPPQIKISLSCDGFADPATMTMGLTAHLSPVAGGSYDFPAAASDLRIGEYWSGQSESHASGFGSQLFAYDLGVVAFDSASHNWSDRLPNKDGTKNEHYRIWGKPVRAMADGIVVGFKNDHPTNPNPPAVVSANPVEGNHFWIRHGTEVALYAHLQAGTLTPSFIQTPNAVVHRGDVLGLAGNSGNSTAPHLHTHVMTGNAPWGGPLRPLPFRHMSVINRTALHPPDPAGAWVKAEDQGLPNVTAAIWPAQSDPAWYPPGWAELARHGISEAAYQTEFDRAVSSGYRPVWLDGYDVNGTTFFNVIFRAADGTAWQARHGLTAAGFQQEFNTWTQQGYRLINIESYLSGGQVRYAAIFARTAGPEWMAYHGRSADDHQQQFNTLTQQGFRPINVSAVSPNGSRTYAALYEKRDVGSFVLKSFLTLPEYQTQFDQNLHDGRKLTYVSAYTHSGSPRISAIWTQQGGAPFAARHGMTSDQYQNEFDTQLANGLLLRAVTGYADGNQSRFAALWSR